MEPFGWLIDLINEWIGGDPGTPRWEIVTAVFGWLGVAALLGWMGTSLAGFPGIAGYLIAFFWIAFGIAFRRDLAKVRHMAKRRRNRTR